MESSFSRARADPFLGFTLISCVSPKFSQQFSPIYYQASAVTRSWDEQEGLSLRAGLAHHQVSGRDRDDGQSCGRPGAR